MTMYLKHIELTVSAESAQEAHDVAIGACEHLEDTFNDMGTIRATMAPLDTGISPPGTSIEGSECDSGIELD